MANRPMGKAELVELGSKAAASLASLVDQALHDRGVPLGAMDIEFTAVMTADLPVLPDPKVTLHFRVSLVPGMTRPRVEVTDGTFSITRA